MVWSCAVGAWISSLRSSGLDWNVLSDLGCLVQPSLDDQFLQKCNLKLSDPRLLHLTRDLLSVLGRAVGHCLVRASPSGNLLGCKI